MSSQLKNSVLIISTKPFVEISVFLVIYKIKNNNNKLENDIIFYKFIEFLPEQDQEKGLFYYHGFMLTDVESSFDNIKDAMIQRFNEKAKKLFIKVKL